MTDISDLVSRLREAADPTIDTDNPWWWNSPETGGPAGLLRDAADAFESPNMIDLALYALMRIQQDHENHLYPKDREAFRASSERLRQMKAEGFK